jgi:hypothetical protein
MAFTSTPTLSAQGRQLWSDIDDEEEAAMNANEAAASTSAETLTNSISRTTFRTTPVCVRELANMGRKIFMCHSLDTTARLRTLIFSKFGIPSASQGLLSRGVIVGDGDNTLFSPHLLGERLVHVVDLRVLEVRVKMLGGFADLQLQIPPSLLVSTLQSRICAATGFDPNNFRLSMGIFALMDNFRFQAYGAVGGRVDVVIHVRVRGGRALPQLSAGLNGFVPPSPVEFHVDDLPDLQFPPSPEDDPIEQFTTDDESSEDDDLLSVAESATDSTASADSLPGYDDDDDSGHQLFMHRQLRWNNMMAAFTDMSLAAVPAPPSPSYSQATTLRYVMSPVDEQVADTTGPPTAPAIDSDGEVELLGPALKRQRLGDPEDAGFQITVRTLSGSTLLLWVENADTIEAVKRQILCVLRWILSQPRDLILVLGGIQLDDARTIQECGITSGTQLTLVLRLRGGMQNADDSDPFSSPDASMPGDTGGVGSAFDEPPAPLPAPAPAAAPAVADPQAFETMTR